MSPAVRRPLLSLALLASALFAGGCVTQAGGPGSASSAQSRPAMPSGAYLASGYQLLEAGEPELAYKAFLNAIRVDGASAEALTGTGIALAQQGLLTAARRQFEQALELDPEYVTAYNNLGVVLLRLKEYYAARDAFRAAFALSSGRDGIAERNLNRAQAVVAELEKAEQPNPAVSHRVVRLGTGEFRITPSETAATEMVTAE